MAFKSSGTTVINDYGSLRHKSFRSASLDTILDTETKITASDGIFDDEFGTSVAVGNGRIVIGATGGVNATGSAYIFDLEGAQLAKITASDGSSNDSFGYSVAIGSGRIVVGARDEGTAAGAAYIFDLDGNQLAKITASDRANSDRFGYSVGVGNGRIVVGAAQDDDNGTDSGSAYIFDLDGNQLAKITASDGTASAYFGFSAAIGNGKIVVGAYGADSFTGSAYIFDLDGNQLAKITASDAATSSNFGISVAVGSGKIVVGANRVDSFTGSAYIFDLDGTQLAKITASDGIASDYFGRGVSVGSGRILVGSNGDDDNGSGSGSAYIFDLDGTQLAKITASDGADNDAFARAVAVGEGKLVLGAAGDDDNGTSSGSAYIFDLEETFDSYIESITRR